MRESPEVNASPEQSALAGKYLTFRLASEEYGLEIFRVRELIGLMDITPVPRTPEYIRGVINLRGRIIPVLSLRARFGLERVEDHKRSCIIVTEIPWGDDFMQLGIHVDGVSEVLDITEEEIDPSPAFGDAVDTRFILGVAKCKGGVRLLLNSNHLLSPSDLQRTEAAARGELQTN